MATITDEASLPHLPTAHLLLCHLFPNGPPTGIWWEWGLGTPALNYSQSSDVPQWRRTHNCWLTDCVSISKPSRPEISNIHLISNKGCRFQLSCFLSLNFLKVQASKMLPVNGMPSNTEEMREKFVSERKC